MSGLLIPSKICFGYLLMCYIFEEYSLLRKHMAKHYIQWDGPTIGNFMRLDIIADLETSPVTILF